MLWTRDFTPEEEALFDRTDMARAPNGRMRPLRLLPTPWLHGIIKATCKGWYNRGNPTAIARAIEAVKVLRTRPDFYESSYTQQLVPLPCHCGKRGDYVFGNMTFCREHRQQAVTKRNAYSRKLEPRGAAIAEAKLASDYKLLSREDFRRTKQKHR